VTPDAAEPSRADIDRSSGDLVLEFGAGWCPICNTARPLIDRVLADHPEVRRIWVEDGKGKPLGRSFRIKLWPTLVFLRDGREVDRVVRPTGEVRLREAFARLSSAADSATSP
jgi:thioredoxin 1